MAGEGNTSVEKDFQIQLLDQFKPVVRTDRADEVTEASARLLAELLESAGTAEIKEWGILGFPPIRIYRWRIIVPDLFIESNRSTSF